MEAERIAEASSSALGKCTPSLKWRMGKYFKLSLQTYKASNAADIKVQPFTDSKCKKKAGKEVNVTRVQMTACMNGNMGSLKNMHSLTPPNFVAPGLVVSSFHGRTCGATTASQPAADPFKVSIYGNDVCTNNTISDNIFMKSMRTYPQYGYVYEFSEPDCFGMSTYLSLPGGQYPNSNVGSCLDYKTHSARIDVNMAGPTSMPTYAPISGPNHLFNASIIPVAMRQEYTIAVPPGTMSIDATLFSYEGDCNVYVSTITFPTENMNIMWSSTLTTSPEYVMNINNVWTYGAPLSQAVSVLYVSVYGVGVNNFCQFGYNINWA